jgi:hypothetical protein
VCGDPEATRHYEDVLTVVHWDTLPVRSAEKYQRLQRAPILGVIQELPGQASARLNKEIQVIVLILCPRNHYEWMALQEGPEANGGYPEDDILARSQSKWLLQVYAEPDRTMFVCDMGSCTAITEDAILADHDNTLGDEYEQKQSSRDIQVRTGERLVGGQVSLYRVR